MDTASAESSGTVIKELLTVNERTLLFGGPVVTQNSRRETHEAIVLEGDRILGTGTKSDMSSLAGQGARSINVDGATILPGIIDSHPHFLHTGAQDVWSVNLYDAKDHDDIVARIRAHAAHVPPGTWIMTTPVGAPNYLLRGSYKDLAEGRLPDRHVLDKAAPDHPVFISALPPVVPNIVAMNSKALEMLGITRDLPDRVGDVWIEKADGEPTGIFTGTVTSYYNPDKFWREQVQAKMMGGPPPDELWYQGGLLGQQRAHRWGTTGAYECHAMEISHLLGYKRLRDDGRLKMRVMGSLEVAPAPWDFGASNTPEHIRFNLAHAALLTSDIDPILRFKGATLGMDGPCWTGLLRMNKPYRDPYGRPTTGHDFVTKEMEREVIKYCVDHKIRLNLIQAGLVDHEQFLDIVDVEDLAAEIRELDWVTQHNMVIDEETIRRYADMRLHMTISMSFRWGKGDMYRERLGDDMMDKIVPVGSFFASGGNISLGQDWSPFSPFEHMKLAQTGELALSDFPCDKHTHTISAQQALDGWTVNTAKLMQWEGIGALMAGYKADIAIVDQNPLTAHLDALAGAEVLRTVFDGRDVYDTGVLGRIDDAAIPPLHPALAR